MVSREGGSKAGEARARVDASVGTLGREAEGEGEAFGCRWDGGPRWRDEPWEFTQPISPAWSTLIPGTCMRAYTHVFILFY